MTKSNFEILPIKDKFIILSSPNAISEWDGIRHVTRQELYQCLEQDYNKSYLDACGYTLLCNLFARLINRPDLVEFIE